VDVTPRPAVTTTRTRHPAAVALLAVVLIVGGFVVFKGLRSATLYYYNADEAVAKQADLGDDRFRVQGTVREGVDQVGDTVRFDIEFNGTTVAVRHVGDPPELFRPGIPVVLEGRWDGDVFASDRILIKHSADYKERNPDRVPSDAP
jgi:cytochrome c-type biogenesis protein CcmE